ncbi:MAG: gamma carbonic anhydrase family protein [Clostridia bacterium]|nr:gamma carbonic anhydrase family protein [Clostridia bacterium]
MHKPLIRSYQGKKPQVDPSAFIAETAVLIGDVTVGPQSSIWYGTILRGDVYPIVVGSQSNIQDQTVVHDQVVIGDRVTIGHGVILHGCTIEDDALVGMGAVVLDGVVIQRGAMVAAGALVAGGTVVEAGSLYAGMPAVFKRTLDPERLEHNRMIIKHHLQHVEQYLENPAEPVAQEKENGTSLSNNRV